MKETNEENAAVLAAYEITARKAEHMIRSDAFDTSSATDWEDHRQDAALAIVKKKGEPQGYLTVTGLRAMKYSHAAALRDRYIQMQRPQSDDPDDADGRESMAAEPARPRSWARWRRARFTLEEIAPTLSWKTIRTLAAFLAEEMNLNAAAKRLAVPRTTAYRMFLRAAKEFRHQCAFKP